MDFSAFQAARWANKISKSSKYAHGWFVSSFFSHNKSCQKSHSRKSEVPAHSRQNCSVKCIELSSQTKLICLVSIRRIPAEQTTKLHRISQAPIKIAER
jgi:hypothetical protein